MFQYLHHYTCIYDLVIPKCSSIYHRYTCIQDLVIPKCSSIYTTTPVSRTLIFLNVLVSNLLKIGSAGMQFKPKQSTYIKSRFLKMYFIYSIFTIFSSELVFTNVGEYQVAVRYAKHRLIKPLQVFFLFFFQLKQFFFLHTFN